MRRVHTLVARTAWCLLLLGCALPAAAQHWAELTPSEGPVPAPRRNATAIYDPVGHRVVLFGGRAASGDVNDVWAFELDAHRWTELTPPEGPAPAPRLTPNGVYDPAAHQLIIWSGQGASFFNDVWAFDLTTYRWTQFEPPAPRPNIRYGAASVFDPETRSVVTFAGFTDQGRFDDTWRFDVGAAAWAAGAAGGAAPGERCLHTASFDGHARQMLVYGGQRSGPLGDLWALDLEDGTWTELTPAEGPAPRFFAPSIYDARNRRLIVFGGNRGPAGLSDEVWAFELQAGAWEALAPSGSGPAAREGAVAVYVEADDRMVIIGGRGSELLGDVWALEQLSGAGTATEPLPEDVAAFEAAFPNPFDAATTLRYSLRAPMQVVLRIYDVTGRQVRLLVDRMDAAGTHRVLWDGRDDGQRLLAPGLYLGRLTAGGAAQTRKLLLVR